MKSCDNLVSHPDKNYNKCDKGVSFMIGIGKASGKLILSGEHAVVYNRPAIALPFLGASITTRISSSELRFLDCIIYQGPLEKAPPVLNSLIELIQATLNKINQKDAMFSIHIDSDIPIGAGLGSSASVAASCVRALYHYFGEKLDDEVLNELVFVAERINHLNPSGLDSTTIIQEKTIRFQKDRGIVVLEANLDAYFVIADTGLNGDTKEVVSAVRTRLDHHPQEVDQIMDAIALITEEMGDALRTNHVKRVGELMDQNQSRLQELGVSHERLDYLIKTAKQNGALGAKLTGSGQGGCILALSSERKIAEKIADELIKSGAKQTWIMNLKEE